jgi:acetyltransferase-like isoleucine patch superfamily enzyme
LKINEEQSIGNFTADMIIRCFNNKHMIYSVFPEFGAKFEISVNQKRVFTNLYNTIKNNLFETTIFVHGNQEYKIDDVFFHSKFGWTISTHAGKAYLGKINKTEDSVIQIGLMSYISGFSNIYGNGKLIIGSFTSIADGFEVFTSNYSHPTHLVSTYNFTGNARIVEEGKQLKTEFEKQSVNNDCIVGNDVWIGKDVCIMNGVEIADGSVVGMKSMVNKNTDDFGIYVGTPAKLIRYRFENKRINELLKMRWWRLSLSDLKKNNILK